MRMISRRHLTAEERNDVIYFFQDSVTNEIKIGWAANWLRRIRELQPGNPHPLIVLGTMKGNHKQEKLLHRQFRHLWVFGEWFEPADDLLSFIASNCEERGR